MGRGLVLVAFGAPPLTEVECEGIIGPRFI
jgi:hypothetical protein